MESADEDEVPDLVPISTSKIPVTIITGYLGIYSTAEPPITRAIVFSQVLVRRLCSTIF